MATEINSRWAFASSLKMVLDEFDLAIVKDDGSPDEGVFLLPFQKSLAVFNSDNVHIGYNNFISGNAQVRFKNAEKSDG